MVEKITIRDNDDEHGRPQYGRVRTPSQLGQLHRRERKRRGLTLANIYDATSLSTRFLSEFERGKENASLGRVLFALQSLGLDVLVLPREEAERVSRELDQRPFIVSGQP